MAAEVAAMRIAIIGAGNVGGALGRAFSDVGHDVVFGVRDPDSDKTRAALSTAPGTSASSPSEAVADADVVVVAGRPGGIAETVAGLPALDARGGIGAVDRLGGGPQTRTGRDPPGAPPPPP